jgi:hypothetical protein
VNENICPEVVNLKGESENGNNDKECGLTLMLTKVNITSLNAQFQLWEQRYHILGKGKRGVNVN